MINKWLFLLLRKSLSTVPDSEHGREETGQSLEGRGQTEATEQRTQVALQTSRLDVPLAAADRALKEACP